MQAPWKLDRTIQDGRRYERLVFEALAYHEVQPLLEFRLWRAIRLPWFLTQDGSVSHARSWANWAALPACDT